MMDDDNLEWVLMMWGSGLQQQDVILRVTTSCICGSDLHMYMGAMPGMKSGDVVGHEFMGIVEAVGPEVQGIQQGK